MDKVACTPILRRYFLKRSAAAIALPQILAPSAFGANERITLGLIGIGRRMQTHLDTLLQRDDLHIAALCDVETTRLLDAQHRVNAAYLERTGKLSATTCKTYRDHTDLLARDDLDAILIATPDHWHAIQAVHARPNTHPLPPTRPTGRRCRAETCSPRCTR